MADITLKVRELGDGSAGRAETGRKLFKWLLKGKGRGLRFTPH
jgi:hypothetical protein